MIIRSLYFPLKSWKESHVHINPNEWIVYVNEREWCDFYMEDILTQLWQPFFPQNVDLKWSTDQNIHIWHFVPAKSYWLCLLGIANCPIWIKNFCQNFRYFSSNKKILSISENISTVQNQVKYSFTWHWYAPKHIFTRINYFCPQKMKGILSMLKILKNYLNTYRPS